MKKIISKHSPIRSRDHRLSHPQAASSHRLVDITARALRGGRMGGLMGVVSGAELAGATWSVIRHGDLFCVGVAVIKYFRFIQNLASFPLLLFETPRA